jgi:hypothetical protein
MGYSLHWYIEIKSKCSRVMCKSNKSQYTGKAEFCFNMALIILNLSTAKLLFLHIKLALSIAVLGSVK